MFQLFSYEMCFVGLLIEVQHRQYVIFHMIHVIQDKTMCLALDGWMCGCVDVWMCGWGGVEVLSHMGISVFFPCS